MNMKTKVAYRGKSLSWFTVLEDSESIMAARRGSGQVWQLEREAEVSHAKHQALSRQRMRRGCGTAHSEPDLVTYFLEQSDPSPQPLQTVTPMGIK